MLVVHILHMTPQIATLGEGLFALWTLERSLARVLPEMVSEVAAFLENAVASFEFTFEVQFESLSLTVLDLDGFVPVVWDPWEGLRKAVFLRQLHLLAGRVAILRVQLGLGPVNLGFGIKLNLDYFVRIKLS